MNFKGEKMKQKFTDYIFESRYKICQNENRTYFEELRYFLGWNLTKIKDFINQNLEAWGFDAPLNLCNLSNHFSKHSPSEEAFLKEYPSYKKLKKT